MDQQTPNKRLRLVRVLLNITQTEFARGLGFKQSHLSAIEGGKKEISVNLIYALVSRFKVSANWLLTGEGEMFLAPRDQAVYSAPGKNQSDPPAPATVVNSAPARFYLDEAELMKRIHEMETAIVKEGYLPLRHLCELIARVFRHEPDYVPLRQLPVPGGAAVAADNLSPVMSAPDLSGFENKVFYFGQLEQVLDAWQETFHQHFQQFYAKLLASEETVY